jgi:hypothetical protein
MIEQQRLIGSIDQLQGIIFFDIQGNNENKLGPGAVIVGKEQRRWDSNIQRLAERVEKVASMIEDQNPVRKFSLFLCIPSNFNRNFSRLVLCISKTIILH